MPVCNTAIGKKQPKVGKKQVFKNKL